MDASIPENRSVDASSQKLRLGFCEAAGITFQLPRGRDVGPQPKLSCRAWLGLLVAVACLVGRWCSWLLVAGAGLWGFFVDFLSLRGRRPRTGISAGIPIAFMSPRQQRSVSHAFSTATAMSFSFRAS